MRRDKHGSTRPRTWNILSKILRSMHSKNTTSSRWHPTYDNITNRKGDDEHYGSLYVQCSRDCVHVRLLWLKVKDFLQHSLKPLKPYLFINLPSRIFCYVIHVLEYIIAFTLLCFTHPEHLGNFTKTDKQIPLSIKHQTTRI